ncbi:MAG: HAD family hydrolase [Myxococcota bacterium]
MIHPPIQAVLLDMGGVLIPEVVSYEAAVRDRDLLSTLRDLGVADPETYVIERANRLRVAYSALNEACTQPDVDEVWSDTPSPVRKLLLQALGRQEAQRPYSYARGVVAGLARSYRLGLVSNNVIPGDQHARALRRAGILEHIESALWSANTGRRKPDPAMIHAVLAELRVPPRAAIFVGDKLRTDVAAARAAGVRSVYLQKRNGAEPPGPRPDFRLRDLRELPLLLRRLR